MEAGEEDVPLHDLVSRRRHSDGISTVADHAVSEASLSRIQPTP